MHLDWETEHKAEHQGKAGGLFSLPSSSGSGGGTGEVEREPPAASAQDGPSASEGDTTMAVVATATTQP